MGTMFDDPNREAVGLEPAWVEGTSAFWSAAIGSSEDASNANPLGNAL